MTDPAVMIYEAVAARVVNILTESIVTEIVKGIGIETEIKNVIVVIVIVKGTGTEKGTRRGSGIETEKGTEKETEIGTGTEKETESGTENERGIENRVMIMIVGPNMQREKAEGTMREAVVIVAADIIAVEAVAVAGVGAGAEVIACKLEWHLIRAPIEMRTRKGHRHLATWQRSGICTVI